jgi:hypothetical protein
LIVAGGTLNVSFILRHRRRGDGFERWGVQSSWK